jgi:uncharacterized protein YndB with AHSA1/START domain
MTARKSSIKKTAGRRIVIRRVIKAPCQRVFKAWTDSKQMAQWWSPEGVECRSVSAAVKAGGAYRIHMVSKNGEHIAIGKYKQIVRNKRLQFTWEWETYAMPESVVTVEFEDLGATTRLTFVHEGFPDKEDASDHKKGWTSAIKKFARLIEENKINSAKPGTKKHPAAKARPLVIERTFNAPIAKVWRAITNKSVMKQWSFDIKEFKPEVGFEFQFYGEKDGVKYFHRCKITEVIPGKKLAYSWRYEGHEGNSLVTFELFAEGGKTRLRLTHEGLESFPRTPAFARANFTEGWTCLIGSQLKEFVET